MNGDTPKYKPRNERRNPALANYKNEFIFLVGGGWIGKTLSSVEIYSIEAERW